MKWRVGRPDLQFVNLPPKPVDPDIVGAEWVEIYSGSLVFSSGVISATTRTPVSCVVKAYAPGQWTTVERVEDE